MDLENQVHLMESMRKRIYGLCQDTQRLFSPNAQLALTLFGPMSYSDAIAMDDKIDRMWDTISQGALQQGNYFRSATTIELFTHDREFIPKHYNQDSRGSGFMYSQIHPDSDDFYFVKVSKIIFIAKVCAGRNGNTKIFIDGKCAREVIRGM